MLSYSLPCLSGLPGCAGFWAPGCRTSTGRSGSPRCLTTLHQSGCSATSLPSERTPSGSCGCWSPNAPGPLSPFRRPLLTNADLGLGDHTSAATRTIASTATSTANPHFTTNTSRGSLSLIDTVPPVRPGFSLSRTAGASRDPWIGLRALEVSQSSGICSHAFSKAPDASAVG
jgi:hypothetical protein